jgi:hypothetical protein
VLSKASITTCSSPLSIKKLDCFPERRGWQKHNKKIGSIQNKEDEFIAKLDNLFDIAHADVLTVM